MVLCSWKAEWLLISASVLCGFAIDPVPVVFVSVGMMLDQWDFRNSMEN